MQVKPGLYKQIKTGAVYQVQAISCHTETRDVMVVYTAVPHSPSNIIWAMPLGLFQAKFSVVNNVPF